MSYLIAVVVLVGVVGLLNLVLTYGVIRRLREHTELLSGGAAEAPWPAPGTEIGAFAATTTAGRDLRTADLADGLQVGFFRTGCAPCQERMPQFAARAEAAGDPERFLAVLAGDPQELAGEIARLAPVAQVVLTGRDSDVIKAFEVTAFPTLVLVGPQPRCAGRGRRTEPGPRRRLYRRPPGRRPRRA
ncbi:hypothetical protein AB0M46_29135, partial [Dactylosporangium sp. NPDC051485]|uniref:TlpA family protein disulfide reductase n=1 Tax=Dactylosporangium sp. NPDC051485 TaxID=3154846 RepID=UPI003417A878